MIAATSASSASAALSTAARAADASVAQGETLATNSASCLVDHAELAISAGRQDHKGLVAEAAGTSYPGVVDRLGARSFPGAGTGPNREPAISWHAAPQQRCWPTTLLA